MDAAEAFALPQDLVFVDLETTGGNAAHDRITEVGVVRMSGGVVIEEWSSLVNPERRIPAYIESFTGITNAMVADAPRFADIAQVVRLKLGVCASGSAGTPLFVAHNARFDYSFLRTEFRRLGLAFDARVLCTVKLSRRLFPEFPRHNLDAVMERHRLTCTARHRALGDARVLGDLWSRLIDDLQPGVLAAATRAVLGSSRLPDHLPAGLADELPEGPGVYRFFDGDGVLLYIGRSHSLRTRILGHFVQEGRDTREQKKSLLVRRIDWTETAGDLGARLLEARWLRTQTPVFNKRVKGAGANHSLYWPAHATAPGIVALGDLQTRDLADCHGVFHSHKDARKALVDIVRAHSLCLRALGFEEGNGSCLAYQVGKCRGACIGKEPAVLHALRVRAALSSLHLKSWPYPGPVALREGRDEFHVLDHWVHLGTVRSEEELAEFSGLQPVPAFDADVYRILVRHLSKNPDAQWRDLRLHHAV